MYSALSVAQTFLDLAREEGKPMTNMQLQKLVFFAHGVSLAGLDQPLIDGDIKAWNFGPVIPKLYNKLKKYGLSEITEDLMGPHDEQRPDNDPSAMRAIKAVWNTYKNYDAWELSELSHRQGSPWDIVWNERGERFQQIPEDVIKAYYKQRVKPSRAPEPA